VRFKFNALRFARSYASSYLLPAVLINLAALPDQAYRYSPF